MSCYAGVCFTARDQAALSISSWCWHSTDEELSWSRRSSSLDLVLSDSADCQTSDSSARSLWRWTACQWPASSPYRSCAPSRRGPSARAWPASSPRPPLCLTTLTHGHTLLSMELDPYWPYNMVLVSQVCTDLFVHNVARTTFVDINNGSRLD